MKLMATAQIADLLGISRQRVHQLSEKHDFPEPVAVLPVGRIWLAEDIRSWASRNRPDLNDNQP